MGQAAASRLAQHEDQSGAVLPMTTHEARQQQLQQEQQEQQQLLQGDEQQQQMMIDEPPRDGKDAAPLAAQTRSGDEEQQQELQEALGAAREEALSRTEDAADARAAQEAPLPIATAILIDNKPVSGPERRQQGPPSPTRRASNSRHKRRSTYEKAQQHEAAEEHLLSARQRGCLFLLLFVLIICMAMTHTIYESVAAALNRAYIELPPNDDVQLPSLNLFDYDKDYSYPIFPEDFPIGLQRKIMPQMPDKEGKDEHVWHSFLYNIELQGGNIVKQLVDLRFTQPLQSELSGHIVFNVLFGDTGSRIREKVEADPHFFAERIILVRTPEALIGKQGERIPAGTLFNLDGHHTNEVLKHCARIQHPSLRHGYIDNNQHICGKGFRTRQTVLVIEDVHPLTVIDLALEAGASSGHGLIAYDQ